MFFSWSSIFCPRSRMTCDFRSQTSVSGFFPSLMRSLFSAGSWSVCGLCNGGGSAMLVIWMFHRAKASKSNRMPQSARTSSWIIRRREMLEREYISESGTEPPPTSTHRQPAHKEAKVQRNVPAWHPTNQTSFISVLIPLSVPVFSNLASFPSLTL